MKTVFLFFETQVYFATMNHSFSFVCLLYNVPIRWHINYFFFELIQPLVRTILIGAQEHKPHI